MSGLLLLFVLTGCQGRSNEHSKDVANAVFVLDPVTNADTLNSEMQIAMERGIVLQQVKNIYRFVKSDYMAHGGVFENELFDKAFCSKSWNKLLMAVRRKEWKTNTLFYEINPWSMTREDGVQVYFDEFEVTNLMMEPQMMASVSFTVYESVTYTPARIDLVYEDGRWVIDNFHNLRYMLDVRNCMWNYLENDLI